MKNILLRSQIKYPLSQKQDFIKLLYQGYYGPGHFVSNYDKCYQYLLEEAKNVQKSSNCELYEYISQNYARINLYPYISLNLPLNWLCNAFVDSSQVNYRSEGCFEENLNLLDNLLDENVLKGENIEDQHYSFSGDVHHSKIYSEAYFPSYRVVGNAYIDERLRQLKLENYLKKISEKHHQAIIAVEGKCCSGKTSICSRLKGVTIISADDFFLPDQLKTDERLSEIGGNIDYLRLEMVLKAIKHHENFSYLAYDCSSKSFRRKEIEFVEDIVIVEGVYSYHKSLRKYYQGMVYFNVFEEDRIERLKKRNLKLFPKFIELWMPLEDRYYDSEKIYLLADTII